MALYTAFLDACVMVPIAPCDTLLRLAEAGSFRPLWSRQVTDEAITALKTIHPQIDVNRFYSRFRSMDEAFEDALVEGWESLQQGIELPDSNDCHVVAASLRGRADAIITNNIKDFPQETLKLYGLESVTLDNFLLDQFDLDKVATIRVLKQQAAAMTRPEVSVEKLLEQISRGGASGFAEEVLRWLEDTSKSNQVDGVGTSS